MSVFESLSNIRPDSTFLTLKEYRNQNDEVSDFQIIFHASYEAALKKSIDILNAYNPNDNLEEQAKDELITSFKNSLNKIQNDSEEANEHYHRVIVDGKTVKGVKVHKETGIGYVFGLLHKKVIQKHGSYKTVNKQPLTIAKDKLRAMVPASNWRQFIIKPGSCKYIRVERLTLLPDI